MTSIMFVLIILSVVAVCLLIALLVSLNKKPKVDKQLQILDAYIDSVAKANDLITVSLPINNGKIYRRLIKKLQQDFQELHRMLGSVKDVDKISYGNFLFQCKSCWDRPRFKNKEIYNCNEYCDSWELSPSETLSLMKEWPEAKLEILKIHKQNILDFNHIVNELANLV